MGDFYLSDCRMSVSRALAPDLITTVTEIKPQHRVLSLLNLYFSILQYPNYSILIIVNVQDLSNRFRHCCLKSLSHASHVKDYLRQA